VAQGGGVSSIFFRDKKQIFDAAMRLFVPQSTKQL
jgi:hypothetical protein